MSGRMMAVLAIVAVIAVSSIGVAYAYTSITNSSDNDMEADAYIVATNSYGDTFIGIPSVAYNRAGPNLYLPESGGSEVNGTLDVNSSTGTSYVRMWVTMEDTMSWTVIQRITVKIDSDTEHVCYDWNDTAPQTSRSTDPIQVTDGEHTFKITVTYRSSLTSDPNSYSMGIKSSVVFALGAEGNDPLTAPSP